MERREFYIEIPLSEYERIVDGRAENRCLAHNAIEDALKFKAELEEMKTAHARLTDQYERVVTELESYKRAYDFKEDQ